MPNHTENTFMFNRIITNKEKEKIQELLFTDNQLDFNKLISQPEKIIKVNINDTIKKAYNWFFYFNPEKLTDEELIATLSDENKSDEIQDMYSNLSQEKQKEFDQIYTTMSKDKKISDWYEWNIHNWGVKWNAYETTISDTDITFYTAWAKPNNNLIKLIFNKLQEVFLDDIQEVKYQVQYEGEDEIDIFTLKDF